MSSRREMGQLIRELEHRGFSVTRTGSGHWMIRPPKGEGVVILAFSPRSVNYQRSLKRLREIGFQR